MELMKCKTCGGLLNVTEGMTICECEYCGYKNPVANLKEKETIIERTIIQQGANAQSVGNYLKRAFTLLKDGKYSEAGKYCDKALDMEPENAEAYLGKLMAELRVRKRSELGYCRELFDKSHNYQKVMDLGSSELKAELRGYIDLIKERKENDRKEEIYSSAVQAFNSTEIKEFNEKKFEETAQKFAEIYMYKDAKDYRDKCLENAAACKPMTSYSMAQYYLEKHDYNSAIRELESIRGYQDADQLLAKVRGDAERLLAAARAKEEKRLNRQKFFFGLYLLDAAAVVLYWIIMIFVADTFEPRGLLAFAMVFGSVIHSVVSGLIGKLCDKSSDKFRFIGTVAVNLFKTIVLFTVELVGGESLSILLIVTAIDFVIGLLIACGFRSKNKT